jgi:microcystin-dependent protein
MYPDETTITIDGKTYAYPGLENGKFTDGDPADPSSPGSFIPAATVNLLLDNVADAVTKLGGTPNNVGAEQLGTMLLDYVDNMRFVKPGSVIMFDANNPGPVVTAGAFVVGRSYTIASIGTTNFVAIGAASSTVGVTFVATGVGAGTGTAYDLKYATGAWVDNVTMPGWYACVPENASKGCPDLTSRFVMGKVAAGAGATGGTNSYQLTTANLPAHTHTIDHDHAAVNTGGMSANTTHSHGITDPGHTHGVLGNGGSFSGSIGQSIGGSGPTYSTQSATTGITVQTSSSIDHTHLVDLPAFSGTSGNGGFSATAIDNRPAFYSLIFIKKIVA